MFRRATIRTTAISALLVICCRDYAEPPSSFVIATAVGERESIVGSSNTRAAGINDEKAVAAYEYR